MFCSDRQRFLVRMVLQIKGTKHDWLGCVMNRVGVRKKCTKSHTTQQSTSAERSEAERHECVHVRNHLSTQAVLLTTRICHTLSFVFGWWTCVTVPGCTWLFDSLPSCTSLRLFASGQWESIYSLIWNLQRNHWHKNVGSHLFFEPRNRHTVVPKVGPTFSSKCCPALRLSGRF